MKQDIENIIIKNLPKPQETYPINVEKQDEKWNYLNGFNQAISQIDTSLIVDEVLKVVVEKIKEEVEKYEPAYESEDKAIVSFGKQLLSNLSINEENKNNERN
jgi:2-hydroxy-3-keto-5-methylthiopentenyl-1-phosphate phosphatase